MSILLAKLFPLSPANGSLATLDISAPDRADLLALPVSMENRVTIPTPPTHAVEMRQNWSPRGSDSMSLRIEAPVVVNPEILSKMAFTSVNSLP